MFSWNKSIFLIFIFIATVYSVKKLEVEFLKSGVGSAKNKTWSTVFVNWTTDRMDVLCERALNDSDQFKDGKLSKLVSKSIQFKVEKHAPVKVNVLKCPTAMKKYIIESGRGDDCYIIMTEERNSKDKNDDSIFIEREVCHLGLM